MKEVQIENPFHPIPMFAPVPLTVSPRGWLFQNPIPAIKARPPRGWLLGAGPGERAVDRCLAKPG